MNKTKGIYKWLKTAGKKFGDKTQLELALNLVKEEVEELITAVQEDDKAEIKDAIIDIEWVTRNVSYFYGITQKELENTSRKVMISNFSKFCTSEEEAVESVKSYNQKGINVSYKMVGDYWVLFRDDGKIMKSIKYIPVENL